MESIRILHASDLHIAEFANLKSFADTTSSFSSFFGFLKHPSLANSYDPTILQAFADFVKNQESLDAILLTGDIATTGSSADLEKANRFFIGGAVPWFGKPFGGFQEPSLAEVGTPIWMMPGNHDRFLKTARGGFKPGGREFHSVFKNFWDNDVRCYPPLERAGFSVGVLAADFSLRSSKDVGRWPPNRYSQGRVYQDVLQKLESETKRLRDEVRQIAIFWAIHFPPEYPNLVSCMKLLKSEDLIQAGNDCGVVAILSGHTHKRKNYATRAMKFEVFCAGTATEHLPTQPNHFQILNITYAANQFAVQLEHFEYNHPRAEFLKSD